VQKPLSLVVVGGILLAPVLILVILPVLIDVFARRERAAGHRRCNPSRPNSQAMRAGVQGDGQ
jgi:cobalt-zinc-cadmium resistance protein CzcA